MSNPHFHNDITFQRISIVFSIFALLTLAYIYFPESIDDAYITLRFSSNLLHGNGPVFNIGERIEGYSNFSWMTLLSCAGYTGIPMEAAMKFLSVLSGIGTLVLVRAISLRWFKSDIAIGTAMLIIGFSSFFAIWSVDGLETMFYTLLITALIYLLATVQKHSNALSIGIIASIITLTRPEGIMFAIIAVLYLYFRHGFVPAFKAFIPIAICAGGYEIFRIIYFGEFVSNTAIAKVHTSLDTIKNGVRYLYAYNASSGYFILPTALAGTAALKKRPELGIPIIFIFAQIIFLMVSGGDYMYGYRFIIPIIPCFALLCASAFNILDARFSKSFILGAIVVLIGSQSFNQYTSLPNKHIGTDNISYRSAPHFDIANFLSRNTRSTDWILLSEAGIIPYYTDARVIDYLGLVSPFYSVYNVDHSINNSYLFSHKPKFVVISFIEDQQGHIKPRMAVEDSIIKYPDFREHYKAVRNYNIAKNSSFLNNIYYHYSPNAKRIFFTIFERNLTTENSL